MLWLTLVANAVEIEAEGYLTSDLSPILDIVRVGDLDRDGYDDVVLRTEAGPVWVPGGPFGPEPESARTLRGAAGASLNLRDDVAAVGDQNGDGYPDLAVTHREHREGGALLLFLGGANGPATTPWRQVTGVADAVLRALGDLNGDRVTDFGAWTPKGLFVYRGGASRFMHEAFMPLTGYPQDLTTFSDLEGMSSDLLLFGHRDGYNEVWTAARTGTWTWATPVLQSRIGLLPVNNRPISSDGRYSVGFLLSPARGYTWYTGLGGAVGSWYGDCSYGSCGNDVAVFDTSAGPVVLVGTDAGIRVLDFDGPADELLLRAGPMVENAGDLDGDGVDDVVAWSGRSHGWTFISGGQFGLW
jgi:hypothetical protein